MIRFLHTADWQLGKPFASIRDADKRARARQARIDAAERLGALAREEGAAFVLVAGDLFDSPTADRSTVSAGCRAIGRIGLPVIAIPGNHDHGGPGSIWERAFFRREREQLAPNLIVLQEARPYLDLEGAILLPCPLRRRQAVDDPVAWLREAAVWGALAEDPRPRVVLAHGSVQAFESAWEEDEEDVDTFSGRLDLERLPEDQYDYVALGDWHGVKQVGPKAWYSGAPEPDRFPKGSGHDAGNVLLVEAVRGEPPRTARHATGALGWRSLESAVHGEEDLDRLRQRLEASVAEDAAGSLLALRLEGELGIEASRQLDALVESLEARFLRLKLDNRVRVAPTEAETAALVDRGSDPLVSSVAAKLLERAGSAAGNGEEEDAQAARVALRELYHFVRSEEGASP